MRNHAAVPSWTSGQERGWLAATIANPRRRKRNAGSPRLSWRSL
ncbi:hypothetical protein LC55x_4420 [Lysobacter capsici]|nr:hypothetical protein LC55x_4420 [Lysobacter capsici]